MATGPYSIAAFYRFVAVADGARLRERLMDQCRGHNILGTILIAPEGINATIAGEAAQLEAFLALLAGDHRFCGLDIKRSHCAARPFQRLKVKLKREIVTFGVPEADPNARCGITVEPTAWNDLIADPDIVLIDTRNTYEIGVGSFPGAIDPNTRSFGQFPAFVSQNIDTLKSRKIAMFCTGGIRCEKATSYLIGLGFDEVYHLKGGILRYLEVIPPSESRFAGECYVFDERVAVAEGVAEGRHTACASCGRPAVNGEACGVCAKR